MCRLSNLFKTKQQSPVQFVLFQISGEDLRKKLVDLGYRVPLGTLDSVYSFTDAEGWAEVLADMTFNSNLYKAEVFDCEDYAMKACVTCWERYGLNAFGLVLGMTPAGYHGFNIGLTARAFSYMSQTRALASAARSPWASTGTLPQ